MKKTAVLTIILVSLMALSVVCVRPIKAQYQSNITIKANGSVNPSTSPIQKMGNLYTLTSNVDGSITVQRNNIILDGNGHTLSNVISLASASNVTVKNLIIRRSSIGIKLWDTSNAIVTNNTIAEASNLPFKPTAGIYVEGASSNIIAGNNLENNQVAIVLSAAYHNVIVENNITGSSVAGITFWSASDNIIYHNNFVNNAIQAQDPGVGYFSDYQAYPVNTWDDGYPGGGNYWSDYLTRYPNATEIDSSGIGDTPYVVYTNNTDRYPLMESFNKFYVLATTPPKISVLSPLNQTYNETSVPLVFAVDKHVNWTGYSLDGQETVTVTGNCTIANVTNGLHSVTVYANDTFGNIGASEAVSFTIAKPEPFPTLLAVAVAIVVAAVMLVAAVGVGLSIYLKKHK
jgi:parallel beta-helix repeat protein